MCKKLASAGFLLYSENMTNETTIKQVKTLKNGNPINVSRQFGQPNGNPRHNGAWKKEDTARYKLERMLELTEPELRDLASNKDAPLFERKLATCIAKGNWRELEGMMTQVYGQPKQKIETTVTAPKPLVNLTERKKNGES